MKAGWEVKALGDVAKTVTGNTPPKSKAELYGTNMPFVKPPQLLDDYIETTIDGLSHEGEKLARVAPVNSILVSCIGNLGKLGIVQRPSAFNQQINAIYPNPTTFNSRYIFYYCQSSSFLGQLNDLAGGTTVPIVNKKNFNSLEIPLPPLEEQKRIVAVLDAAFEGLTRARTHIETNLQNARELFEVGATKVFTKIAVTARVQRLGEFASFRNGLNFSQSSKGMPIRMVGVGDFKDLFWIPDEDLKTIQVDGKISADDLIEDGDILAVRSNGNPALIGRTMLCKGLTAPTSFSGFSIRIRMKSDKLEPEYACCFLKTRAMREILSEGGDGANISNLNQKMLAALSLPIPSVQDQAATVKLIQRLKIESEGLQAHYRTKLHDLDDLRRSLLQKAFAGELT